LPVPIVLCYHALSPSWTADISTTPERLERQVRLLLGRGYRAVRFTEVVQSPDRGKLLAVTFDDAFASVARHGAPVLARLGVPATLFVPTDHVDAGGLLQWPGIDRWRGGPWEQELEAMSWAEVAALQRSGWEIGSHTGSHPHLTTVDDGALDAELVRSKAACEQRLEGACTAIAYPYGDVDARVATAAARAGYAAGAALPGRLGDRDPMRWPRTGVYQVDDERRFRLKVSPAMTTLRRSPAWGAIREWGPVARASGRSGQQVD